MGTLIRVTGTTTTGTTTTGTTHTTVDLALPQARYAAVAGSKAAALAAAANTGLPVIPGFAITTAAHAAFVVAGRVLPAAVVDSLRAPWAELSLDGAVPLVTRSSSTVEDVGSSSMAGRFRSILDVRGWEAFLEAVASVMASADEVSDGDPNPMGVLVQRYLPADRGGVMFGVDPVTGDRRRFVVEAVSGGPDSLVSGRVSAQHYVITRRGRLETIDHHPARLLRPPVKAPLLRPHDLRALARLALAAERAFGTPQDVEWAIDRSGSLLLLQSRPVTATGDATTAIGPVLGPGPVAESFPDPLSRLEIDLWIEPLRAGVAAAFGETRAVPRRHLSSSPVVTTVRGRVAADLELFGYVPRRRALAVLDPRPSVRRLAAAWHVGRLRAVLPGRAASLFQQVDETLASVSLADAADPELLDRLETCRDLLQRLHHEEVLAGAVLPKAERTAASLALATLARERARGVTDGALVRAHPEVLALSPPAIGSPVLLPAVPSGTTTTADDADGGVADLGLREQLRLRARWVQELGARIAWELGRRLVARELLTDPGAVALLDHAELAVVLREGRRPSCLEERERELAAAFSPPLPAQFRASDDGVVVPAARRGSRPDAGVGAGGGRGVGRVSHGSVRQPPEPGDVLVVRELHPGLAASLPGLAGLVAETGGTLSHLAILAREYGVPTVVAVHDALQRFPAGERVLVDGTTGEVSLVGEEES